MNIRQNLLPEGKYSLKSPYKMEPELIVFHNTDNDASAWDEIAYMIRNDSEVAFHYAVDDIEVVQGVPLDRNAWHAGDGPGGRGNRKGIAIEICYSESGGPKFDAAERNAAKLGAQLLHERGWGIDRVTNHKEMSGKYCPRRTLDLGWNRFLDMIREELKAYEAPKGYSVTVGPYKTEAEAATLRAWLKFAGIEGEVVALDKEPAAVVKPEKPAESAPVKDYQAVAKKVARGDYGNGEARKQALRAEGYTEAEIKQIQDLVNAMF